MPRCENCPNAKENTAAAERGSDGSYVLLDMNGDLEYAHNYVIMFASRHQYANMAIAIAALVGSLLLGVGLSFLAAKGDKKRFSQKVVSNFWANILPPW
jgi:hypothetical protein